ncbi:MAG: YkgJ family cysteine cluster protein [Pseudomonadota bacterium]
MIDERSSSDLCNACGLCCNGVLFDHVAIEAGESEQVARLGFALSTAKEGGERFAQPCPMFRNNCCSIYADRPGSCRGYRCELLKKLEAGEIGFDAAIGRVAEAKAILERIRPLLDGRRDGAAGKQWAALLKEWQSRSPEERAAGQEGHLVLELALLNRFLNLHFRSESDIRRVMGED